METSTRRGIQYPSADRMDTSDAPRDFKSVVDALELDLMYDQLARGSMTPGIEGRVLWATDEKVAYYDDGSTLWPMGGGLGGWAIATETWAYVSADGRSGVVRASNDKTQTYSAGMRARYVQSGVTKYGVITAVGSFSGGGTNLTILHPVGTSLVNAPISSPYYSFSKIPVGFPISPASWNVEVQDTQRRQTSSGGWGFPWTPVTGVQSLVIPPGVWSLRLRASPFASSGSSSGWGAMYYGMSSNDVSLSDAELAGGISVVQAEMVSSSVYLEKIKTLAAKTTYKLMWSAPNTQTPNLGFTGEVFPTILSAEFLLL